jgi:dynein heavy chain
LKEHQQSKDEIIEELKEEIKECNLRKRRADTLLRGLSSEKQKWIVCMRMLSSKNNTVVGDVILSSCFITLLSGFEQKYRERCLHKWNRVLNDLGFTRTTEFSLVELFGDSYKIRKWHQNHLPGDSMSVNNAVVLEKTKRFSLIIDP